jgi:hypothetical protein
MVYGSITILQGENVSIVGGVGNSANNNRVNIAGNIESESSGNELMICGGVANRGGAANNNRVNISGTIESKGDITIVGAVAEHTAGNIVSISGKIVSTETSHITVTIAGSDGALPSKELKN